MEEQRYEFVEEVIRKTPSFAQRILKRILSWLGLALVFGVGVVIIIFLLRDNLKEILYKEDGYPKGQANGKIYVGLNDGKGDSEKTEDLSINTIIEKSMVSVNTPVDNSPEMEFICTGVIVSKDENIYVLVPHEKIKNKTDLVVTFAGGNTVSGVLWNVDQKLGIAAVEVSREELDEEVLETIASAPIGSGSIAKGDHCIYEGNALGDEVLVYEGNIAGISQENDTYDISIHRIYTDLMMGNVQDGFLFDKNANLTGMVLDNGKDGLTGTVSAVALYDIYDIICGMLNREEIGYIGIQGDYVDYDIKKYISDDIPNGLYVLSVDSQGTAYKAGIMMGDIIMQVNNVEIEGTDDIFKSISDKKPGEQIEVCLQRKMGKEYEEMMVSVLIGKR